MRQIPLLRNPAERGLLVELRSLFARAAELAAQLFRQDYVVGAQLHPDREGLLVSTREPGRFFLDLNRWVLDLNLAVDSVAPADDDVKALYEYLIEGEGRAS